MNAFPSVKENMLLFSSIVFFLSLLSVVGLFAVKYLENKHERILHPSFRQKADEHAIKLKELAHMSRGELSKLPPRAIIVAKAAIHASALGIARFAREMESRAHQLADLVSHKHRFEKRETRSEFLKQVGEHPMSNGNGSNGRADSENGSERL